ncbi:MAG: hypothetical protein R2764_16020 [Bacteroidales bacterium]
MKRIIILTSLCISLTSFVKSQNCTQCDNSGNPPGTYASEIGQNTTADGDWSFAGGYSSQSSGVLSFAFGANCNSDGPYSVTLGHSIEAYGLQSMVIGTGAGNEESELLKNYNSQSLMIGFGSEKPSLYVGPSSPGHTGSIGIGDITNPQAKLHIKADNGEQAALFIEPYTFGGTYDAELWMGTSAYGLRAAFGKLYFNTGGHYIFNSADANVGIGVLAPVEKLEVNGNINISKGNALLTDRVQGTGQKGLNLAGPSGIGIYVAYNGKVGIGLTNPSNELEVNGKIKTSSIQISTGYGNGKLLQSDAMGNALWSDPAWTISGSNVYRTVGNVGIGTPATSNRLEVAGTVNATNFVGDGSGLTNISGDNLGNHVATQNIQMSGRWLSGDGGDEGIYVKNDGSVGIGLSPSCNLDVSQTFKCGEILGNNSISSDYFQIAGSTNTDAASILFGCGSQYSDLKLVSNGIGGIAFYTKDAGVTYQRMTINNNSVFVGTSVNQGTLTVYGKIDAEEIEVHDIIWQDQVFKEDYNLKSIYDLEKYIKEFGHLPDIPSESEIDENGANLGDIQAMLLRKIEELTLYVIELKHENERIKNSINKN